MDAEREDGRLERRDGHLALREDADEGRRQRAVSRGHRPLAFLGAVVVEYDDVHVGAPGHLLELTEARRIRRLDDDQPRDRRRVEPRGLYQLELVDVQAAEVPDVPVQRAGERHDRAGVEPPAGEHRREGVEIGVRMACDDVHRISVGAGPVRPCPRRRGRTWLRAAQVPPLHCGRLVVGAGPVRPCAVRRLAPSTFVP